ncbi:G-alpha-domain-containing protein [Fistulina hepatica ATCC 64428]|uniref:G-alpha-domain-containing protein n=1 Tax=Fistulina hepatica ATCC 64428 TaxID=1128425 RepID=A0A0D7A2E1_9AGAR|nr:G-alpha-domain-containing protein [Fistulina hepatica ATCC 64428]
MKKRSVPDPFAVLTAPPPGETAEERAARESQESEARQVSERIDEQLKQEHIALLKRHVVRVLLLGQSESGKSTTLKNFRMHYAAEEWKRERAAWRVVIRLNLVRSVLTILAAVQNALDGDSGTQPSLSGINQVPRSPLSPSSSDDDTDPIALTEADAHAHIREPLTRADYVLRTHLVADGAAGILPTADNPEFRIRACDVHAFLAGGGEESDVHDVADVLAQYADEITSMWREPNVRRILQRRGIEMEDNASFFVNDIDRIARRDYEPSDDDIVRARLRTMGVQEYRIFPDPTPGNLSSIGKLRVREWLLYDVGGSRTMRHYWIPYFDNMDAIIFLAPVSCFDERLAEDPTVNRLEDSVLLWRAVCSSKLLAGTTLVLFLNKVDLLRKKLNRGVQVKRYLPSYGDRPNETNSFLKYLRTKFRDIERHASTLPRNCSIYTTSVTDTRATALTLTTVKDGILRSHLKTADFI